MRYAVGDQVLLRVSKDNTVIFDVDYNDSRYIKMKTNYFTIIAKSEPWYIIQTTEEVAGSLALSDEFCSHNNIHPKYIGSYFYTIQEPAIGGKKNVYVGECCAHCRQWFQWAEPNQKDGRFFCWSCKTDGRIKYIYQLD